MLQPNNSAAGHRPHLRHSVCPRHPPSRAAASAARRALAGSARVSVEGAGTGEHHMPALPSKGKSRDLSVARPESKWPITGSQRQAIARSIGKFNCKSSCVCIATRPLERSRRRKCGNQSSILQSAGPATQPAGAMDTTGRIFGAAATKHFESASTSERNQRAAEQRVGWLLRPPFGTAGMAVERAARWATPASTSSIPAAGDEQADLGVARVGFSELQSLEQQQRLPLFFAPGSVARARGWRGVACFGPLNPLGPSGN